MKICIAIDKWKLAIFSEALTAEGYVFKKEDGGAGMWFLFVQTDDAVALGKVVQRCQNKAAELKG